jgi:hypothetical protein
MNCHPDGDSPTHGNDMHVHMPPVTRGEGGLGVAGNTCNACHTRMVKKLERPEKPVVHRAEAYSSA